MRRNTQDAVQKTRRAKQAAADRKTESSSISFICTAHKIPTATMRPSGLKVMYNTQRPRCGYRTGPCRHSKERRKRRERKKNLNLGEEKRCSRTWKSNHTRGSAVVQISRVWDTQTSANNQVTRFKITSIHFLPHSDAHYELHQGVINTAKCLNALSCHHVIGPSAIIGHGT